MSVSHERAEPAKYGPNTGYLAVTLVCVCITEGETTLAREVANKIMLTEATNRYLLPIYL